MFRLITGLIWVDANDIDECLRNNEENEGNEAGFNLHDTLVDCLF
jgi:hypothetical protein